MLRKLALVLLFGLFAHLGARATHISGGEIYYDCLGNNQYRITLVIYRDCIGIALNNSYTLNLTSPCGNRTLTVSTPGGVEISQLCSIQLPNSTCRGGSLPGIQRYVYTGTITLPPCDSWTISWSATFRNAAIANLVDPDDQATYIKAVMNTATGNCNDSPQFTNTAIPYVCAGYPISYSYGAFDPEGDSLSYQLVGAMTTNGQALAYNPPYSALQPIPGITVDPVTGLVNFTLNQQGNWVVVVRVNEYRNGVLIGSIMRDMQFVAYPCSNIPPDPTTGTVANLSGTAEQTGPRAIEVCESGNFCFDAVISDPNAANVLTATTNLSQNLPGATITYTGTNPLRAHVCWTASPGTSGFFPFIITVNDGACPIPALQTYVYAVQVREGLQFNVTSTNESCGGVGDGSATANVTVGTAPYQYNWSNGATTASINVGAGSYNVTVTDANGCVTAPGSATITAARQPGVANGGPDLVGCSGELPVALTGNVSNAGGGHWYGGSGGFDGTGLNDTYMPTPQEVQAGAVELYFATTGTGACPPDVDTVQVALPTSFIGSYVTSVDATCADATNGTASYVSTTDGLSFLWNDVNAQTGQTATGLASGEYNVRVTDSYGCDTVLPVIINAPVQLAIANINVAYEQCAGNNDGSITVSVTGGTQPYHYAWSNGDTTATIHVGAGTYTVDVSDASGCTVPQATATVTALGQPNQANAGADLVGCFGQLPVTLNGSVVNATGGMWSGGSGSFSGSGLTVDYMPSPEEIMAGGVELYLSTSGNATCPPAVDAVFVTLSHSFFHTSVAAQNANCFGTSTGSAEFLPDVPGFTFQWNDASAQTTRVATGLPSGEYNVRVTDALGCDTVIPAIITEPAQLAIADLAVVDEQCAGNNDGTVTATITGGTEPYTYNWSNGAHTSAITVGAGTYTLTVSDANGCSAAQASATVHAIGQPNQANAGGDLIGCFSQLPVSLNGTVVNATGGTWSGGAGTFTGTGLNVQYMPSSAEINAGGVDLFLTTTGNTTCTADRDTVHVSLSHSFFHTSVAAQNANCFGTSTGSAEFLPDAAGLAFRWNDAAAQTTRIATGLPAGNYNVRVTDALGCDTTLSVTIGSPAQLAIADLAVVDEQCAGNNDGTVTATITGGTQPYTYNWSNGAHTSAITVGAGTYTLTVSDANGCSAAQASATVHAIGQPNQANAGGDLIGCFSQLPVSLNGSVVNATGGTWSGGAGTFTGTGLNVQYMPSPAEINAGGVDLFLTTTGNITCATDRDTVHVSLSHSFFHTSVAAQNANCFGASTGSAEFLPDAAGLAFRWNDAAAQTTRIATGLPSGEYNVRVTDALGCDTTLSVTIGSPAQLAIASLVAVDEQCAGNNDGSVTATITGGTEPYTYNWSNGAHTSAITVGAGTYTLTVSDANGCSAAQASATVHAIGQPNQANAGGDLIGCFSQLPVSLNGSVVNATGGTWSGGAGTFTGTGLNVQYMPSPAEINAGGVDLFLTTTGNTTCTADRDTVHVSLSHSFFHSTITATGVGCNGGSNGTASFFPNTPGFCFTWNDPSTQHTSTATGLASGTYTVHVTDPLGCDTTASVFVPQPTVLVATGVTVTDPTCPGGGNGSALVTVAGGTAPYAFLWSPNASNQTGQTAIALSAGTYVVRVRDANGCTTHAAGTLVSPPMMTLAAQVADTVCVNAPVQLTAQAAGGTGPLTVNWAGIAQGDTLMYAFAASQNVVVSVSDANGCTGPALTLPVTVLNLHNATLHTDGDTTLCPGGSAVVRAWVTGYPEAVTLTWTEPGLTGTGPYTLPMIDDSTLHVVATDACGLSLNGQVAINVETPPAITLPAIIAEGCAPLTVHFPALTNQPVSYLWTLGDGTTSTSTMPVHIYPEGDYSVSLTVTTPAGCVGYSANSGQVIAYGVPVAAFTASAWQTGFTDGPVQFTDQSTGDISAYDWSFGDGGHSEVPDPSHQFNTVGNLLVELSVTSPHGCVSTVSHPVTIDPDYNIVIPNAFTPDPSGGGGGVYDPNALDNDVFYPFIRFVKDFNMRIYNRWGELVFETNDIRQGWDGYYRGQISQQDVYVYKMQVRFVDDKQVERMGDLTLFR